MEFLTAEDVHLLVLLAGGASTRHLSRNFFVADATVHRWIRGLMDRVGARNRTHLVVRALEEEWITLPLSAPPAGPRRAEGRP